VIIGAENAPRHLVRVCKKEWIDDLVKQCKDADCPVYVKQQHDNDAGRLVKNPGGWPTRQQAQ
jgi:protein gp37